MTTTTRPVAPTTAPTTTPTTGDTDTPATDPVTAALSAILTVHQTVPAVDRPAALMTADVLAAVAAADGDADVTAAYAAAMSGTDWVDPFAPERRTLSVLVAGIVDTLTTLPTGDRADVLAAVLGDPGTLSGGWTTADPAAIGRVVVGARPPAPSTTGSSGTTRAAVTTRDVGRLADMTFTRSGTHNGTPYTGSVTVTRDGIWVTADGVRHAGPSPAAVHTQGGGSVNGWGWWRNADGMTPDQVANG